jgi:hypothetical protein
MRNVIYGLALLLAVLHHDFWFWDSTTLVLGFAPVGLAYHVVFSFAVAGVWALAVKYAWPVHIEEWADEFDEVEAVEPEMVAQMTPQEPSDG